MKEDLIKIVKEIIPKFEKKDFDEPFSNVNIDSIDLVTIRTEIESQYDIEFSDKIWFRFKSLKDILNHLRVEKIESRLKTAKKAGVEIKQAIEINMPQMSNSALSENWLFKEIGNIHWKLLALGLGEKSSGLNDEFGDRLYATFIAITLSSKPLFEYKENQVLNISANIERYGNNIYKTNIISDKFLSAELLTSFTKRNSQGNSSLQKSIPVVWKNNISKVSFFPSLQEYKLARKNLTEEVYLNDEKFIISETVIYETTHQIIPFYEINGVGLLYFAAYPIINDICEFKFVKEVKKLENWAKNYYTQSRKILYMANCDSNDTIVYRLHSFEKLANRAKIYSTLYRKSDMVKIAEVYTLKGKRS